MQPPKACAQRINSYNGETMKRLITIAILLAVAGCTDQQRTKAFGGTMNEDLSPGQKFVTITWEDDHLWIATRPMRTEEQP
jgi:uncharacterized lipoprotein YehR (DUF1307 family)